MRYIYLIFFLGFFLIPAISLRAQVSFSATVSPGKIGMKDYATLRYSVNGSFEIEHIYPPDFKQVELVSGPSSESKELVVNGKTTRSISFLFVVKPLKPGKIKLPPARARVAGTDYESNPLLLEVINAPTVEGVADSNNKETVSDEVLRPGDDVDERVKKNMVLRLETDKKEVFVGEPVLASFKLYSRLKSNSRLTENPSFNGFSVVDLQLPDVTESSTGSLNGREFNIYTIRKVLLYPLQSGTFTIERLQLENNVQFIQAGVAPGSYDLFSFFDQGYGSFVSKQVMLETEPGDIVVKPLPTKDRPEKFSGAVGNFSIDSRLAETSFNSNDEGRLIVEITGDGNLQLINAPELLWPGGIDAFDPKIDDTINTSEFPVFGRKRFEYVFSVSKPGSYIIPPVSFSFFDPEKKSYVTRETDPLFFNVTAAERNKAQMPQDLSTGAREKNSSAAWLLLPAAALAAVLLAFIFQKLRKEYVTGKSEAPEAAPVVNDVKTQVVSTLESSSKHCHEGNRSDFYPELNRELKGWLLSTFCLQPGEASMDKLRQCMDEKNIPNSLVLEVQSLLREIEWELYVPGSGSEKMHEHFARARTLIQSLETRVA